jgi:hypothetical protein
VIKRQNEPGSPNKSVTIQSNNSGNNGNGCFATASDVCWIGFHSFICLSIDAVVGRIRMNQSFTPGRRLSSILLDAWTTLTRENLTQPIFADLTTRMYSINFTLGNSNLVLSIPSAKHNEVSWWILLQGFFAHNVHKLKVKLENFVEGSARQQWEFTRVGDLQQIR